ncbi:AlpA family transcriptional regulator [Mycolicibacterium sp. P9-22]|uniref:helix-turn-helix transcriptional regulator n=1 Tax=Mycolicibacterium sp. P9-22 TaxID=2024613 RepID=UPI0011EE64AD|nr:helix-turn-helix domain-containing protein [Mycolicibacterium sp. P9-22]KAA0109116.1 DNA-binding protein [Mycolicibacterium sp. P9-22]
MHDYLDVHEASALCGLPVSTLRHYRHANTGPESFRIGKKAVWPRHELLAWIEAQRAASLRGGSIDHYVAECA